MEVGLPVGMHSEAFRFSSSNATAHANKIRAVKETSKASCREPGALAIPSNLRKPAGAVVAFSVGHDASIAISKYGRVQCVLELERFFNKRYYSPPTSERDGPGASNFDKFASEWLAALNAVRNHCDCEDGKFPDRFDVGVFVDVTHCKRGSMICQLPLIFERFFHVERWEGVHHHEAHALLGYHASPFRSALVISYDGGGDDGHFNVFLGSMGQLHRILRHRLDFGAAYQYLARLMPEITGFPIDFLCKGLTDMTHEEFSHNASQIMHRPMATVLGDAGKLMGYAATGKLIPEVRAEVRRFMEHVANNGISTRSFDIVPRRILDELCGADQSASPQGQRNVAASIQAEFEDMVQLKIREIVELVTAQQSVEGLVLTGGCALNVLVNQMVRDNMTAASVNASLINPSSGLLDIYVPPSPNDSGLALGGLWAIEPPTIRQPLQYVGFRLWDRDVLESVARDRDAIRLENLGGIRYLAELLAGGPAWREQPHRKTEKPIIAIVRGRQEFGPRALGHRSLVAVPDSEVMRDRMNRLKFRQWWRPVAPMIADEALMETFGDVVKSPTMEMAPRVRDEVRKRFPAIVHADGTARHQSVGQKDEPWLHALLLAVGKQIGLPVLINTSLTSRGKPIANTIKDSLAMLDELPDLDYVLIEEWLFSAPIKSKRNPEMDEHWVAQQKLQPTQPITAGTGCSRA